MLNIDRAWRLATIVVAIGGLAATSGCQTPSRSKGPMVQAVSNCVDFTVPIYFEPGSVVVTHEAGQLIVAAHQRTNGCNVTGISVTGLADAPGSAEVNLDLSKRRAAAVTRALAKQGFTNLAFQVAAAGDVGAQTKAGQSKPLRRRATVEFHLAPATKAAR